MQRHAHRHFTAYIITAVLYGLTVFLIYYSQTHKFVSSQKPKESVIQMSLSQFVPPAPPTPIIEKIEEPIPVEPILEPEPVVEKEIEEEPEVIKEVIPEPVVEKKTITPVKKIVKKEEKPKKKVVKKKKETKKTTKKKEVKKKKKRQTASRQASRKQNQSSTAEKNKFWNTLRRKIDKKKSYPHIAKKRGMEGIINVKFTILRNGNVGNISVNGPKIFHNSARQAVKKAFPINVQESPVSLPTSINIKLRYQLR